MKTKRILILALFTLASLPGAWAQAGIDAILHSIEANNPLLQANAHDASSQKLEARASNNLANPSLSYSHLWDSDDKNITVGELVISQGFDFPTLYATRGKVNRLRANALDAQVSDLRQQVLLQAKELCLDIICLHKQQALLDERLRNAEDLASLYNQRLETGDANALETNKINLELLNVRTESRANRIALENALSQLTALNGGIPLAPDPTKDWWNAMGLTEYTPVPLPQDFVPLCDELLASDPSLQALQEESLAADKQISVSKQGWLPKLELGYRRNTETRHPLNGIVVGFSFPLFENRGKVKLAKAQSLSANYRKEDARLKAVANLRQCYDEARSLHASMEEYSRTLSRQQDLALLRQALEGGEISMIEYFVEVSVVYQSKGNLLQLEKQYHKAMARLYKSRL